MKKTTLAIAMLTMMSFGAAQAQTHFSLRFGGNFPTGRFAEATGDYSNGTLNWGLVDNSKKGGAGIGFVAGLQMKYDISSVKGLGIIASVDGMFNTLNSDVVDYFDELVDNRESSTRDYSVTLPKYINIPIMVGLNYTHGISEGLGLFGEVAMGANIRMITDMVTTDEFTTSHNETITTVSYDGATTFGYRLGAGVIIKEKYTLAVDYWSLGMAKASGQTYTEFNGVENTNAPTFKAGKITPTNVTIRLGINF